MVKTFEEGYDLNSVIYVITPQSTPVTGASFSLHFFFLVSPSQCFKILNKTCLSDIIKYGNVNTLCCSTGVYKKNLHNATGGGRADLPPSYCDSHFYFSSNNLCKGKKTCLKLQVKVLKYKNINCNMHLKI